MLSLLGAAGVAMVLSVAFTWMVRGLARSHGWISGPASRRHVHTVPVPRLGGIAVFGSFFAAVCAALRLGLIKESNFLHALLLCSAWMLLVGFADDRIGLRASRKLAGQILGGLFLFSAGVQMPAPGFLSSLGPVVSAVSLLLTVGWSVAVMNAINLVDGLDGLASGSALSITAAALAMAWLAEDPGTALLAAIAIGTLCGFLCFNVHPASIFLGDSGSLFLGAVIAAVTIRIIGVTPLGWVACPIVLAHPFGEVVISTARRFLRRDPISRPDRRHLHHRLLDRGLSHSNAAVVLVAASLVCCVFGVLVSVGGIAGFAAFTLVAVSMAMGIGELRYEEFSHFWRWVRQVPRQRDVIRAQMRLETLTVNVPTARSLTELRILLSESFVAIGCESARLRIRSYDNLAGQALAGPGVVTLVFPLYAGESRLGGLELAWSTRLGSWPFDAELFTEQFLPVLCRKLEKFVHLYRELPVRVSPRRFASEMLPGIAVEAHSGASAPLNS